MGSRSVSAQKRSVPEVPASPDQPSGQPSSDYYGTPLQGAAKPFGSQYRGDLVRCLCALPLRAASTRSLRALPPRATFMRCLQQQGCRDDLGALAVPASAALCVCRKESCGTLPLPLCSALAAGDPWRRLRICTACVRVVSASCAEASGAPARPTTLAASRAQTRQHARRSRTCMIDTLSHQQKLADQLL